VPGNTTLRSQRTVTIVNSNSTGTFFFRFPLKERSMRFLARHDGVGEKVTLPLLRKSSGYTHAGRGPAPGGGFQKRMRCLCRGGVGWRSLCPASFPPLWFGTHAAPANSPEPGRPVTHASSPFSRIRTPARAKQQYYVALGLEQINLFAFPQPQPVSRGLNYRSSPGPQKRWLPMILVRWPRTQGTDDKPRQPASQGTGARATSIQGAQHRGRVRLPV
jgi:hypothetical protein